MNNATAISDQLILVQPTVVVGLGEVGRRSVAHLKRRIYEAYGGPLETVMLLSFTLKGDDEETEKHRTENLPFELLPSEHIALSLRGAHQGAESLKGRFPWLPDGLFGNNGTDYDARCASRLAFMVAMAESVAPFLQENLRRILSASARHAMMEKGFQVATQGAAVYVVAALDDPAGSGLLLDAVYLIRHLLRGIGPIATTTGVLFLPEPETLDETRGANVYAALKELDHLMDGNKFEETYTATITINEEIPPFNHGLYLIDTINERTVALGERDQASAMLGEWLFQASLSHCKSDIDGAIAGASGRQQHVEGRLAEYGSLGLSGYILPIESFIEWCANKLGDDILQNYVRGSQPSSMVAQSVSDFENNLSLPPQQLKANILKGPNLGQEIHSIIDTLEATSYAYLESRIASEAKSFEKTQLPNHVRHVAESAKNHQQTVARALKEEQFKQLNFAATPNHISLARNFFNTLARHLEGFEKSQQAEKEKGKDIVIRHVRNVNKQGGALFRALSTVPRSPLDYILIGLGTLVGFLIPLFMIARFILSVAVPANAGLGYLLLAMLIVVSFGIVGFTIWQIRGRIHQARNEFFGAFRQYVAVCIDQANTRTALSFYPSLLKAANERDEEVLGLHRRVTAIRNDCAQASDVTDSLVGEIDFPLQRSLLKDDFIRSEYARLAGDLSEKYPTFLNEVGTPAKWLSIDSDELKKRILDFGREVFKPLRTHTVNSLLERAPDDATRKRTIQLSAQELLDRAAPMWTYDQFVVGQDLAGAGYLSSYGLLAMDDPRKSDIDDEFQKMKADLKTAATHDPYRMQIIKLRQGYPLFGLRAFDVFRKHYMKVLGSQNGLHGTARPLHITDAYLLAQDPLPYPADLTLTSPIDTIFAAGLIAGVITHEDGGPYVAAPPDGESRPLAATPERSVAMLGTEPQLAAKLSEGINTWVEKHAKEEAIALLKEGARAEGVREWQASAIGRFIQQLES